MSALSHITGPVQKKGCLVTKYTLMFTYLGWARIVENEQLDRAMFPQNVVLQTLSLQNLKVENR